MNLKKLSFLLKAVNITNQNVFLSGEKVTMKNKIQWVMIVCGLSVFIALSGCTQKSVTKPERDKNLAEIESFWKAEKWEETDCVDQTGTWEGTTEIVSRSANCSFLPLNNPKPIPKHEVIMDGCEVKLIYSNGQFEKEGEYIECRLRGNKVSCRGGFQDGLGFTTYKTIGVNDGIKFKGEVFWVWKNDDGSFTCSGVSIDKTTKK